MSSSELCADAYEVVVEDCEYARPDGEALLATIYRPCGAGPFPLLVDVHGGAWRYLDRGVDAYFDRALAAAGLVVVAIDFRQAPAHRYPSAIADVIAGVRFAKANAARWAARADNVGLIGGSSGGHLALLAAVKPDAPEYTTTAFAGQGAQPPDAHVDYVLALWPIADPAARYRYLLERIANPRPGLDRFFQPERLRDGHDEFFGDVATMAIASLPRLLAAGEARALPSIWVAHPELDENVTLAMSEALVDAYRGAGGDAELEIFPNVGHAFANFGGADADGCIDRMRDFIQRQLTRRTS